MTQEGSPSTITKDGGSRAEKLFFPAFSYQKRMNTRQRAKAENKAWSSWDTWVAGAGIGGKVPESVDAQFAT